MSAETTLAFAAGEGLSLAATRYGDEGRPPLLLLHGGGQTRGSWSGAARVLADDGFRVTTLDQRGHGESDWSPAGEYGLDAFADDLRQVLAAFDTPPILVGASLGGLASLLVAGEAPVAAVAGIVLVDIVPWLERRGGEQVAGFMRGTAAGFDTLADAADAIASYLPHRPRPDRLDGLSRNLRQAQDGRWYWHWDPAFVKPQSAWDRDALNRRLTAAASAVRQPIMLVYGTDSEIVSADGAQRFRTLLPDAEVAAIAGAHHMVAGDDNDAFVDAIVPFLRSVTRQAAA